MNLSPKRVSPAEKEVQSYATDASIVQVAKTELQFLSTSLPPGVGLTIDNSGVDTAR
jgi:hypothetical protein